MLSDAQKYSMIAGVAMTLGYLLAVVALAIAWDNHPAGILAVASFGVTALSYLLAFRGIGYLGHGYKPYLSKAAEYLSYLSWLLGALAGLLLLR